MSPYDISKWINKRGEKIVFSYSKITINVGEKIQLENHHLATIKVIIQPRNSNVHLVGKFNEGGLFIQSQSISQQNNLITKGKRVNLQWRNLADII